MDKLLTSEGKLVLIKAKNRNFNDVFKLSEAGGRREKAREAILSYLSSNPEPAVTPSDVTAKILMSVYPNELWSEMETESLLNDLCDKEGKLIRVKDKMSNDAFKITEIERRCQLKQAEAERRRQEEEQAKKRAELESEQDRLQMELADLKGLFAGSRRKKIEVRLTEIQDKLNNI